MCQAFSTFAPTLAPTTAPTSPPTSLAPTPAPTIVATQLRLTTSTFKAGGILDNMRSACTAQAGAGFKPLLSYFEVYDPYNMRDLVLNPSNPIVGPTGIRIADNITQLFDGTLYATLAAAGVCSGSGQEFWTGSYANGMIDADNTCLSVTTGGSWDDWTLSEAPRFGGCGVSASFANTGAVTAGPYSCDIEQRYVLCYKDDAAVVPA